jgi:hypothetical protein
MGEYEDIDDLTDDECRQLLRVIACERDDLRESLAAERARADDLRRVLDAERERGTAFMADRDRLRAAIEQAPHGADCPSNRIDIVGGVRELGAFTELSYVARDCNCWKRAALEAK